MFKRKRLVLLGLVIIAVIFSCAAFLRSHYSVPILMYHSVSPEPNPYMKLLTVKPETFRRQMRFLKERHYNVVPLVEIADLIKNNKKIPPRTLAITFDDGFKDNYTYAFPMLKEYNFPATIFVVINEIGRPEQDRLSWDDIAVMQASGLITFGVHTLTHPYLPGATSQAALQKEIAGSKKILEEKLGRKADSFCYPGGRFDAKSRQAVIAAGYSVAVASNPGKRFADNDVFALKRIRISENCANLFIFWVETSGYYNFMRESKYKK
ncbi:MAG: polysaccharide deacetylase family protein [Candidatus Omnitrophica bacterium]|nr:polysaccharide deacetylase family protein [Candidatus Omnitrophota bacterium]